MTDKHQIFADEYLKDLNGTRAYKVAYPSVKKDETARANASRLLTNANVKKYIDEQLEKILHFYHARHFSSLAYNNLLQAHIKRF